jgi:hypothetical protein
MDRKAERQRARFARIYRDIALLRRLGISSPALVAMGNLPTNESAP